MRCYACVLMSLCSRDLHVTSLNNNYYNTLNSSRLTVVQLTQRLVFGWHNINLLLSISSPLLTQSRFLIVGMCIRDSIHENLMDCGNFHMVRFLYLQSMVQTAVIQP